jgi:hypothetical protein
MRRDFDTELLSGMDHPELYYCTVWEFTVHHAEMVLQIRSDLNEITTTKKLFWIFQRVMYYQGPLKWYGADFHLGSDSECMKLIAQLEPKVARPDVLLDMGLCNLFKFNDSATGLDVNILAGGAIKAENLR